MIRQAQTGDSGPVIVNGPETTETTETVAPKDKSKLGHWNAMMNLIKSTIGGGFLAMPEAFHNAGIFVGSMGTLLLGICVLDTMVFIVKTSQSLRSGKYARMILGERKIRDGDATDEVDEKKFKSKVLILPPLDYPETVAAIFTYGARGMFKRFARIFALSASIMLVITYYGVNIIYVSIISETFKQTVDGYTDDSNPLHGIPINWYPLIISVVIIPIGMVRSLKRLSQFSAVANYCLLAGTIGIFYYFFFGKVITPLKVDQQAKWMIWSMQGLSIFTGSALCSMEGIGMGVNMDVPAVHSQEFT